MDLHTAIRDEIALRERRGRHFDGGLFREPAWDMLLYMALCRIEGRNVATTDACLAGTGQSSGTGLRYISLLVEAGLVYREADSKDGRRVWLRLTGDGFDRVAAVFGAAGLARAA